ncbi:hypothetical protein AB0E69_04875 [Kribbella sp. NPDC026611]|uniref:hypothetical protein n=1 Tax=Kribbella sp. NPDC026611 TaxID=3154911 RepID=UPI003405E7E6
MSNQRSGWQQPQYGGYPPQYGGYPPPPPRKSRTGLIVVLSVVGVLVLVAGGLAVIGFVVERQDGKSNPAAPVATEWNPPATSATPSAASPSGVKVQTVLAAVQAAGFKCKDNGFEWECAKPLNYVTVSYDYTDRTLVSDFQVQTFSGRGPNGMPQGPKKVVASANLYLKLGIPLMFPDPNQRAQVTAWFAQNLGKCPGRHPVPVAGYYLSCEEPTAITVTDKVPMTSWDNVARIERRRLR